MKNYFYNTMQYNCDSILKRTLLTKYRCAWSQAIFGGVFQDVTYFMGGGSEMCDKVW